MNNSPTVAFLTYTEPVGMRDWSTVRPFSLFNISAELHGMFACGYDSLQIRNIVGFYEQDDKNGYFDYNFGDGDIIRFTMIDGMCTWDEHEVYGRPEERNPNYDENNFNALDRIINCIDTDDEETYEGYVIREFEDEGMDLD